MKRHTLPVRPELIKKQRFALALLGFMVLCFAGGALSRGSLHYSNWWGVPVFAPFAIVVAILAFVAALLWRRRERQIYNALKLRDRR